MGIVRQTHEGVITWANLKFWEISGISTGLKDQWKISRMIHVLKEDRKRATQVIHEAISLRTSKTHKFPQRHNNSPQDEMASTQIAGRRTGLDSHYIHWITHSGAGLRYGYQ